MAEPIDTEGEEIVDAPPRRAAAAVAPARPGSIAQSRARIPSGEARSALIARKTDEILATGRVVLPAIANAVLENDSPQDLLWKWMARNR